jgi:hypothetical protein
VFRRIYTVAYHLLTMYLRSSGFLTHIITSELQRCLPDVVDGKFRPLPRP